MGLEERSGKSSCNTAMRRSLLVPHGRSPKCCRPWSCFILHQTTTLILSLYPFGYDVVNMQRFKITCLKLTLTVNAGDRA